MKKMIVLAAMVMAGIGMIAPKVGLAYNFGDHTSETLTSKAWSALAQDDIEAVLAYTNKNLELYSEQAGEMQASLDAFPEGENDEIFAFWALNDIATSLYIQGEAYRKANMVDEAREAYLKVVNNFSYGQSWDPKGWFWKPADAANEKLAMLESGRVYDFGDYSSSFLTTQAWKSLTNDDIDGVMAYTGKVLELYTGKADTMQESMTEYAWESKEKIFSHWALNDVGTSLFIQGEALKKDGRASEAKDAYKKLVDEYYYAQCWDPNGWFWKPAEAAQQAIEEINT